MSDVSDETTKSEDDLGGVPTTNSMAAFSNKLQELTDNLDLLYIRYNASGRNKFRDKVPDIAKYIFGEQLIKYDNEGTQDLEHRAQLEIEAGDRRILLKATLAEFINKSVDKGSLQFDYVGQVIDQYGVGVAKYLYEENIIERVRPGSLAQIVSDNVDDEVSQQGLKGQQENSEIIDSQESSQDNEKLIEEVSEQGLASPDVSAVDEHVSSDDVEEKLSAEEKSILSNSSADNMPLDDLDDDVRPIETPVPLEAKVQKKIEPAPPPTASPSLPASKYDEVMPIDTSSPPPPQEEIKYEAPVEIIEKVAYKELFNSVSMVKVV